VGSVTVQLLEIDVEEIGIRAHMLLSARVPVKYNFLRQIYVLVFAVGIVDCDRRTHRERKNANRTTEKAPVFTPTKKN
jgi:hypothetical protein